VSLAIPLIRKRMSFGAFPVKAKYRLSKGAELEALDLLGEGDAAEGASLTQLFYELASAQFGFLGLNWINVASFPF